MIDYQRKLQEERVKVQEIFTNMYYLKNFTMKGLNPDEYKQNLMRLEHCRAEALAYFEQQSEKHGGNIEQMLRGIRQKIEQGKWEEKTVYDKQP